MFRKILVLVWLGALLGSAPAWAFRAAVVGVGVQSTPDDNINTYTAETGLGGGATLEFQPAPMWTFEIGALYSERKYKTTNALTSTTVTTSGRGLHVPLTLNYWLGKIFFLGAGGYYSRGIGDIRLETTTAGVTTNSSTSFEAAGSTRHDYGVVGSMGFEIPMGATAALLVNGRITQSILDNDKGPDTLKFRDIQGLVGFRFGMLMK
jgi:hypothetical protein